MKKVVLWMVAVLALAVYLNIGWAFGTYMYNNVHYTVPKSFTAKVLAGPHSILSEPDTPENKKPSPLVDQVALSIIWPVVIVIGPIVVWTIYAICYIVWLIVYGVYWTLWIVFAGGLAKLFGIG